MTHLYAGLCALLLIVLLWNLIPLLIVACLPGVPWAHKLRAIASLAAAGAKGLLVLLPDLLAPLVVPIALVFTQREDDHLPRLFAWWDNDVSINGDRPDLEEAYYAPGHHVRSRWARFVWLGLRNRASALSIRLGHAYQPGEYDDAECWGDPAVGRDRAGWTLNRRAGVYQLYAVKRMGRMCTRTNVGHKIWNGPGDQRPVAMVVNITCSLISWTGE